MTTLPQVLVDPSSPAPLHRQVYESIRRSVLDGTLAPGTRLPATRELAASLGVARNTVMLAFEQLIAEGYLEGRVGAGTFVTHSLPDDLLLASRTSAVTPRGGRDENLSARGRLLADTGRLNRREPTRERAFRIGLPDPDAFPFSEWSRILGRVSRKPELALLGYGESAGYRQLRDEIAAYLGAARAVQCDASRVIIVSGSQQAIDLVARVLLDPGDAAWIEEPGYPGARAALAASGARMVPVPVDREGIVVDAGIERAPDARVAFVTPSHQFPLGLTMSLGRRAALLDWAHRAGAWVIEDDFDSEYRYAGRPLASLQGLDGYGRVIYVGTFSKVMFPSLRIGYMVVPPELVDAFISARAIVDRGSPSIEQAALAQFMAEGHLARHIRRMRSLYARRRELLVDAARRRLGGLVEVDAPETGMHVVGWLPDGWDDERAALAAQREGLVVSPLSNYYLGEPPRPGLLLGYAACDERTIETGMIALAKALSTLGAQASR